MKKKKQSNNSEISEPIVPYETKEIHIFSSYEEMDDDYYKWLASLSPEEHLQFAVTLIKRVFATDMKQFPVLGNEIIID